MPFPLKPFFSSHCLVTLIVSSLEQKPGVFVVHKSQLGNSAALTNIIIIIIISIIILFQQQVWFVGYVGVSFPWSNHVSSASCVLINTVRMRTSIYSGKILWQIYDVEYCSVLSLLSLLTFQSLPVTLRTTRFNTQEFYMVITLPLCHLCGCQEQAAAFSLYSIHRLDFITEAESVYSAVRTEY